MVQMDREVRAREGDMDLRTNPKAPVIADPPSRMQEMRYVSPRATASDNNQNRAQNSRRDCSEGACDGADPLAGGPIPRKLQKQQTKSAKSKTEELKSEESKSENHNKSSKPESVHVEISQMKGQLPSALKVTNSKVIGPGSNSSSRDTLLQKHNKEALQGKKSWVKRSDPTTRGSQDENKKKSGTSPSSSSCHSLVYCPLVPETPPKETHSKLGVDSNKGAGSSSDKKGKAKEIQPQQHALVKVTNEERQASESNVTDGGSIVVGSSKAKTWKKDATGATDTHELSYVHDFTDCPVDKNVLDYYENEEKRSQASQQHAPADCSLTSPTSAHYSKTPEQHALKECPEQDASKGTKSATAQSHALADCPMKDTTSKDKSADVQTHTSAEDPIEKGTKAKPAGAQSHALVDCPEKDTTSMMNSACSQPHTLADCPQKNIAKVKAAHSQPHALVDCETSSEAKPSGPQPHSLADCAHESVSNSPTEQHALADCRGDDGRRSRRASSNPGSPTDRHSQTKQHRLASCPVSTPNQKDEKAKIGHHIAENARINESADSQSTVKPSSQHTLSDSMGGAKLERQTVAEARPEKHSSLSSLRDVIKRNQDTADHPRKSRYRKEVENSANASGTKRPSQAQHALTQILGGSGSKKENSREDHVEAIKGAMQSVGDKLRKRADSFGDAVKEQTEKIGGDVKKRTDEIGEEVKKGAENVGHEVTKQADKNRGKEEHKSSGSGFANMLSKMSPRSKAHQ